ncbi:MAG: malate dehydrogenase [candidate division KSB1 bacterium]|nr:malate dehydrogenase [candidate division KSB1 bacterium]MDZ7276305.1 malate dehydrogenase [candidate division KSB1 bacterium]MDZ7287742.1 malate dehydrogenase [candidate division KSB1 bacterium]MDZ7299918.1 malate dehydrogenase [candidate division KSB1 bacterium]MDZ7308378.1 malate dehydrogenase [candidate division KSB1 bacterium]
MKISVIGAGHVGATIALLLAQKRLGDIVLLDVVPGLAEGKALDMAEASPVDRFASNIVGSCRIEDVLDSNLVVMAAGRARTPGMTRMDLLAHNAAIVTSVMRQVAELAPQALVVMVTNPLDVMCYAAWQTTGFPKQRILGMAGALDAARLRYFIAAALNVAVEDIQAMVLGGHGDAMVLLPRYATVSGIPLAQLLPATALAKILERTREAGTEIVQLLKTGSAYYAPAAATAQMVEALVLDERRLLPASVYLEGEYSLHDVFLGVPVILGGNGVEKIVEIELTEEEHEALRLSALEVAEGIREWQKLARPG